MPKITAPIYAARRWARAHQVAPHFECNVARYPQGEGPLTWELVLLPNLYAWRGANRRQVCLQWLVFSVGLTWTRKPVAR